jgi:hypothetical protein
VLCAAVDECRRDVAGLVLVHFRQPTPGADRVLGEFGDPARHRRVPGRQRICCLDGLADLRGIGQGSVEPGEDGREYFGEFGYRAVSGVGNEVDHRVAAALEYQGVVLWNVDVVGAVDDQHRGVAVLIEQRTQRELRHACC